MNEPSPTPAEPGQVVSLAAKKGWKPHIVALVCRWCTYAGADMAGTSRLTYPATVRLVRFPCTGRMDPLFIFKAFEQGADGVLVSGCHPGDCHYIQGNYYARRRFAIFRSLMDFVGLDRRRLQFSWVSAAEGIKWVKVVERVNAEVRAAGPVVRLGAADEASTAELPAAPEAPRAPATRQELEALTAQLQKTARGLLEEGEVSLVLGYTRGTMPGQARAGFITRPEEADSLVWDPQCFPNLSVYLPKMKGHEGKIALVAKKCDVASVVGLLQEGQVKRDKLVILGLPCGGVWSDGGLLSKCFHCDGKMSDLCDKVVTADGPKEVKQAAVAAQDVSDDPRDQAIAYLEALPAAERWRFWQEEFERCLRCYACRAACPLCYCESCISEKHRPQWISTAIDETGNTAWNVARAFHLAGRCTGCDECSRVCPAHIRLDLINRKLALEVETQFGYASGTDQTAAPPLTVFRNDDPEGFIL